MQKLSIIIPVFNNWKYTKNCLDNLSYLNKDIFEIVIVDNNSTDETNKEIHKYKNIKYIKNEENMGFGTAINIGYHSASTKNILMLNNDIKFGNKKNIFIEWFSKLLERLNCSENELIGPTAGFVDPKNKFSFKYETTDFTQQINYMSGWCLSGTKKTLDKLVCDDEIGPFRGKMYFLYFEDTDLSFRALEKDIKFISFPTPLIHIGKQTTKILNTSKHYNNSKIIFTKEWQDYDNIK